MGQPGSNLWLSRLADGEKVRAKEREKGFLRRQGRKAKEKAMIDNEITQNTIELLDKIESVVRASYWVGGSSGWLEELKRDADELRKLIETAEIDKALRRLK